MPSYKTTSTRKSRPSYKIAPIRKTKHSYKETIGFELHRIVEYASELRFFKTLYNVDSDHLDTIVNQKYMTNDGQELTLLIAAVKNKRVRIVKHLLRKCTVDVDAKGTVLHLNEICEGVSALWLAAALGQFEIVKVLINYGATVDSLTSTKSTPLRAASYIGHKDIVRYLFEHGADINTCNVFDCSCLMIASYKGHIDVVKYLLKNGADINKQSNLGATAMHFAAQADNIGIVMILLEFNAQQLKNKQSLTPILVAAERTHFLIVNYLLDTLNLTLEETIEAEELLGASYLDDQNTHYSELGFSILLHSMELRFHKQPFITKKVYKKVEAYKNRIECQTIEELLSIKEDREALHYESLIIRERILGEFNLDLLESLIYRGNVNADFLHYKSCFRLWNHALRISKYNQISIYKDIIRFTQEFFQMIRFGAPIYLSDLKNVWKELIEELKMNQERLLVPNSIYFDKNDVETEYSSNIYSTVCLIIATGEILSYKCSNPEDPLINDIMKIIEKLNKLELKTKDGQMLLHLCLDYQTKVDTIYMTEKFTFPNYRGMKLLISCGADVNALDKYDNTPLHYIGKFIKDCSPVLINSKDSDTRKMVLELLNADAHTDIVNKNGECPHTGFLKTKIKLSTRTPLNLKCLSAKVLSKKWPRKYYYDKLPRSLIEFTNLH